MGIYVDIKLENGKKIGWMEITRVGPPGPHTMPPTEKGEYTYRFKYRGDWGRGVVGGEVFHERSSDVFELIRKVLNHSEPQPEYCQSCGCQFRPATGDEILDLPDRVGPPPRLYVRTEVPEWR